MTRSEINTILQCVDDDWSSGIPKPVSLQIFRIFRSDFRPLLIKLFRPEMISMQILREISSLFVRVADRSFVCKSRSYSHFFSHFPRKIHFIVPRFHVLSHCLNSVKEPFVRALFCSFQTHAEFGMICILRAHQTYFSACYSDFI